MVKSTSRSALLLRILPALVAGLVLFGACSASSPTSAERAPAAGTDVAESAPMDQVPYDTTGGGGTTGGTVTRQIARTATLGLQVTDIDEAADQARSVADSLNGMVADEDIQELKGTADLEISVPSDQLTAALDQLSAIGEVQNRTISATDVTDQVTDVDTRIKTLRESIARLQELIERAGSVTEIAAVENELTTRQMQLEVLLAQQANLGQQVAQATISVSMWTKSSPTPPVTQTGFLAGLEAGWDSMVALGNTALTAFGVLLPYLVLAAIIGLPIFFGRRAWRKKHPKPARPATQPAYHVPQPGQPQPRPQPQPQPQTQPQPQPPASQPQAQASQPPAGDTNKDAGKKA
jgi:hypothetical protein